MSQRRIEDRDCAGGEEEGVACKGEAREQSGSRLS